MRSGSARSDSRSGTGSRIRRLPVPLIVSVGVLLVGLGFLARPAITELVTSMQSENAISEIEAVYDSMSDAARMENIDQAHAFNDRLLGIGTDVDVWDYDMQLTYHDEPSTMMAWIEIPKIGSKLPIYHHATESVLMAGVGHIDTTCLPVGGPGTLCALSGHSGMQNARMFDDIRQLEIGDQFVIWTLGDPYAYSVCDISVVEPTQVESLEPQPGRDLCALVTCTPFNVNTHRLVVMAQRCEYVPEAEPLQKGSAAVVNGRTVPLLAALAAAGLVLTLLATGAWLTRRRRTKNGDR